MMKSVYLEKNKPTQRRDLLQSGLIVSSMTFLSRILGLVRDVCIAQFLGASAAADAFFIAFKIPNFFRRLFAEGAFAQAFVPVLTEYRNQRKIPEIKSLIDHAFGGLSLVLFIITTLAVIGAPLLIWLFAPGFSEDTDKQQLTIQLLRITFPYLLLISLTALLGSILNTYGKFFAPAFAPVLLNICLIIGALTASTFFEPAVLALAYAVLIAGFLQLCLQTPFVSAINRMPKPRLNYSHDGVKRILLLIAPALFGVSVSQLNLLLDTILASFLVTGSISWLYYSDRLMELPLGIFGVAIGTIILPALSKKHAQGKTQDFSKTLDWSIKLVCLVGIPAATALIILAEPLLITLFQYGAFDSNSVYQSALSLRAYALGLLPFMLIKVLAPAYFSRQDTKTPVRIGIKTMVFNMLLNLLLIVPLAHMGLALATSVAASLNAFLLYRGLIKENVYNPQITANKRFIIQTIGASISMALVIYYTLPNTNIWLDLDVYYRSFYLTLFVIGGIFIYFTILLITGLRRHHLIQA